MELAEQILDAWRINARLNLYLLDAIPPERLHTSMAKGKSVAGQFTHLHNVRGMWLKAASPDLYEGMAKLEPGGIDHSLLRRQLEDSGERIASLMQRGLEAGRIKNFKPHPAAFLGYLVAHESNHRTQVEVALRQAGTPLADAVAFGLWEWGVR